VYINFKEQYGRYSQLARLYNGNIVHLFDLVTVRERLISACFLSQLQHQEICLNCLFSGAMMVIHHFSWLLTDKTCD